MRVPPHPDPCREVHIGTSLDGCSYCSAFTEMPSSTFWIILSLDGNFDIDDNFSEIIMSIDDNFEEQNQLLGVRQEPPLPVALLFPGQGSQYARTKEGSLGMAVVRNRTMTCDGTEYL